MSTTTTNLGLFKPELSDPADITKMNPNWDLIDTELKKTQDHSSDTSNPHEVTADQVGALSLDGGTLKGDTIKLGNGTGELYGGEWNAHIAHFNTAGSGANRRELTVVNSSKNDLKTSVFLQDVVDGVSAYYNLFGEHNYPYDYGTADLGAGTSELTTGRLYFVYE